MGHLRRWAGLLAATTVLGLAVGCKTAPSAGDAPAKDSVTLQSEPPPALPDECVFSEGLTLTETDQISEFRKRGCTAIEGDLTVRGPSVHHLLALSDLTEIHGSFHIIDTEHLSDVQGLENLTRIEGAFVVARNHALGGLASMHALERLGGKLVIQSNPQLENLPRLKTYVAPIRGDVVIADNPKLASLRGLESIWHVEGNIRLQGLPVSNLNATLAVVQVDGNLSLINLPKLTGLWLSTFRVSGDLVIAGQLGFLPDCEVNRSEHFAARDIVQGEIHVDSSQTKYIVDDEDSLDYLTRRGCESTTASILIVGTEAKDLSALRTLRSIRGDLIIRSNTNLESLAGLENLEHIGGDFLISHNPALSSVDHLTSLKKIGGKLGFEHLPRLAELEGFERLSMIGNGFSIAHNDNLENIHAFQNLRTVHGDLLFDSNWALQAVGELDPKIITGNVRIVHNPLLSSLGSLGLRARVMGRVDIYPSAHLPEDQLLRLEQEMATTDQDVE